MVKNSKFLSFLFSWAMCIILCGPHYTLGVCELEIPFTWLSFFELPLSNWLAFATTFANFSGFICQGLGDVTILPWPI